MTETDRTEFKRELTPDTDLEEEAVAFLNDSGMGYIMQKYGRENFIFLDNFIRMTIPFITKDREGQVVATEQVEAQVDTNPASNPASSLQVRPQVAPPVTPPVDNLVYRLLKAIGHREKRNAELLLCIGITDRKRLRTRYIKPALEQGLIEMSQPDSPRSPTQKYRLTAKGLAVINHTLAK